MGKFWTFLVNFIKISTVSWTSYEIIRNVWRNVCSNTWKTFSLLKTYTCVNDDQTLWNIEKLSCGHMHFSLLPMGAVELCAGEQKDFLFMKP